MSGSEGSSGDEEDEPLLKYTRLEGSAAQILANDFVSAFALCPTSIVLGSQNGIVYVLDVKGIEVKRYRAHAAAISALSIDKGGSTIASASIDGKVVLYNVSKKETNMYDFKRPVRSVAIDPDYHQNSKGRVLSGGLAGQLILNEKGWMGTKETIVSAAEGSIMQIAWHGNLVAWANDVGVRVYDILNTRMVGIVKRRPGSPRADLYKCRLLWQDSETLIIGWCNHITRVSLHEGINRVVNLSVDIVVKVEYIVSGLSLFGSNLLVMAYIIDTESKEETAGNKGLGERPELRVLNHSFEEISEDAIGLRGFASLQPNDYSVYSDPSGKSFFVVAPQDIVSAREREPKDHIKWLIDMKRYDEAMLSAKAISDLPVELSFAEIGRIYLHHLFDAGRYQQAARLTPDVFSEDVEMWEQYVFMYAEKGHLEAITPFMPTERPTLSSVVYEMALGQYINSNESMLLATLQQWPIDIYSVDDIVSAIEDKLVRASDKSILQEALASLFLKTDRPREALPFYLSLGRPEAFELIQKFHLFDAVQDDILKLVKLDTPAVTADLSPLALANPKAIEMLVQHSHSIPTPKVVAQLKDRPSLLYCYFRALLDHDALLAADYSDLQISLFAEYDRVKLMELLKSTSTYSLEMAAKVCEQRHYIPELVFVLGRMGDNKRAMKLIIEMDDVHQAIAFATDQADPDLWEDLILHSLESPQFIRGLLEYAGAAIDPVSLIRRIPSGLVIDGLKDTLTKIFNDYDLQMSLSQCGSTIHKGDNLQLSARLRRGQNRGMLLRPEQIRDVLQGANGREEVGVVYAFFNGTLVAKTTILDDTVSSLPALGRRHRATIASKITDSAMYQSKIAEYQAKVS